MCINFGSALQEGEWVGGRRGETGRGAQKSRPIESGHGRHAMQVIIEYSYKLGQKMNLNFGAN